MILKKLAAVAVLSGLLALPAAAQTVTPSPPAKTTPMPPKAGTSTSPSATTQPSTSQGLVDINSATPQQLDALPGIGKARADAIVKNRPYKGKDDLVARHILPQNVYDGIKDKIVARQK